MALTHFPSIVTSGLVLYLDAANIKSYPGSGTTWFDLSGNENNFTLFNSPSFSPGNGFINFNGTNQYTRSSSTLDLSTFNSVTVEIGMRVNTTLSPNGMAFEHSSNWNTLSMGFGLLPNSVGSTGYSANSHHTNQLNGTSRFEYDGIIGTDITIHSNIWSRIADTTGRLSYINSVQRVVLNGSTTTAAYTNFRNDYFYISSRGGTSLFANHRVYFLRIYGKKLTSQGIQQNFQALRGRYSI